eukprot:TRINITY_DN9706_c0_g1_i1.p1 TRINITY_DN9706_c0_g1~~TRINITY_DN9706_c0_g1_i1.p1  ORF type:complete len:788 (-),score=154.53 TRINITY_DN9706_c0_g1_i1:34-2187(-)
MSPRIGDGSISPFSFTQHQNMIPRELREYLNTGPFRSLKLSEDGEALAIIYSDNLVELNTVTQGKPELIGSWQLPSWDSTLSHPVCGWNHMNNLFAIASEQSHVYILRAAGTLLHVLKSSEFNFSCGIADLVWRDYGSNSSELLVLTYDCYLHRILVSQTGLVTRMLDGLGEAVKVDLNAYHSSVATMSYHSGTDTLIVGGSIDPQDAASTAELTWPVSVWKFSESLQPTLIFPSNAPISSTKKSPSIFSQVSRLFETVSTKKTKSVLIHQLMFSPNGEHVLAMDLSGAVTIWDAKKFTRVETFSRLTLRKTLRGLDARKEKKSAVLDKKIKDVNELPVRSLYWWDDRSVLLLRRNGDVFIIGILEKFAGNPKNLLGEVPQHFSADTVVSCVADQRFFLLETKDDTIKIPDRIVRDDLTAKVKTAAKYAGLEEVADTVSQQGITPSFTEKKMHVHTLINFMQTDAQSLLLSKIEAGDFDYAIKLAKMYDLSEDLVYQKQWCMNPVQTTTIKEYLSKVKPLSWILRECKERIPDTPKAALELLEFGISLCPLSAFHSVFSPSQSESSFVSSSFHLGSTEPASVCASVTLVELFLYRTILEKYKERLETYLELVKGAYIPEEYLMFRSKKIINTCISLAFEQKWDDISFLFKKHPEETLPYWLALLNHIPEVTPVVNYHSLLPCPKSPFFSFFLGSGEQEKEEEKREEKREKSLTREYR